MIKMQLMKLLQNFHNTIGCISTGLISRGAVAAGKTSHVPSNDSKHEVVVIESIFRLVRKCEKLVHTHSGFSDYIYRSMNGAECISFNKPNPEATTHTDALNNLG
jgi:hypothetical protein